MDIEKDNLKQKEEAESLYQAGRQAWASGKVGQAISLYNRAVALDSDSPAATALEMANRIMAFYDKNQFNP